MVIGFLVWQLGGDKCLMLPILPRLDLGRNGAAPERKRWRYVVEPAQSDCVAVAD